MIISNRIYNLFSSLHAELLRSGHTDRAEITGDMFPLISAVFWVFLNYRDEWAGLVQYLQLANKPEYREGSATLCAPRQLYGGHRFLTPDLELLEALRRAGAITEIGMSYTRCRTRFASERILAWLCDCGAWLELYLYSKIQRSGLADDVVIDAVLSWDDDEDDDDTVNEVDVLAARGPGLYLFSCKTGVPNTAALNELGVLVNRFGGSSARGILVTSTRESALPHAFVKRAESMGLELLAQEDLEEARLDERLGRLFADRADDA